MPNKAIWEEGTEITLDVEAETGATGWTLGYVSVNRVGSLVAVHIEATNAVSAAALVTTLQAEFRPAGTVTTGNGQFTIGTDGTVHFPGSTGSGALRICEAVYQAATPSP